MQSGPGCSLGTAGSFGVPAGGVIGAWGTGLLGDGVGGVGRRGPPAAVAMRGGARAVHGSFSRSVFCQSVPGRGSASEPLSGPVSTRPRQRCLRPSSSKDHSSTRCTSRPSDTSDTGRTTIAGRVPGAAPDTPSQHGSQTPIVQHGEHSGAQTGPHAPQPQPQPHQGSASAWGARKTTIPPRSTVRNNHFRHVSTSISPLSKVPSLSVSPIRSRFTPPPALLNRRYSSPLGFLNHQVTAIPVYPA